MGDQFTMKIVQETTAGATEITLDLRPFAKMRGLMEFDRESVAELEDLLKEILQEGEDELKGRTEADVELIFNQRMRAARINTERYELYRQMMVAMRNARLAKVDGTKPPETDAEMAAVIDTFLRYPGLDSVCLVALAAQALRKAMTENMEDLPTGMQSFVRQQMSAIFAKTIGDELKDPKPKTTLQAIEAGRAGEKSVKDAFPELFK